MAFEYGPEAAANEARVDGCPRCGADHLGGCCAAGCEDEPEPPAGEPEEEGERWGVSFGSVSLGTVRVSPEPAGEPDPGLASVDELAARARERAEERGA